MGLHDPIVEHRALGRQGGAHAVEVDCAFSKNSTCSKRDKNSARWTQNNCHGLSWDPWDNDNVVRVTHAFQSFMGFCRSLFIERIFLNGNQAEADMLRSWFTLVDHTFKILLLASPDWSYIAPKWRTQNSLRPFVLEVISKFPWHQHLLWNKGNKKRVCENKHCAAVECLYYSTHYQFKVDVKAFDLARAPPRYLYISKMDTDWSSSQHLQL